MRRPGDREYPNTALTGDSQPHGASPNLSNSAARRVRCARRQVRLHSAHVSLARTPLPPRHRGAPRPSGTVRRDPRRLAGCLSADDGTTGREDGPGALRAEAGAGRTVTAQTGAEESTLLTAARDPKTNAGGRFHGL